MLRPLPCPPCDEGGAVAVEDEEAPVVATATVLNFVGDGVTAVDAGGGQVDVQIPGGAAVPDGDKGDVAVSGGGTVWTVQNAPPGDSDTRSVVSSVHEEVVHNWGGYPEVTFLQDLGSGNTAWVMVQPLYISVNEFHVDFVVARTGTLIWRL